MGSESLRGGGGNSLSLVLKTNFKGGGGGSSKKKLKSKKLSLPFLWVTQLFNFISKPHHPAFKKIRMHQSPLHVKLRAPHKCTSVHFIYAIEEIHVTLIKKKES